MLTKEQRTSLESKTARYHRNISQASEYLTERGISADSAVSARLGVVDESIPGDPNAAGERLSIPYLTKSGVVDIRYRCIRGHDCGEISCPKYLGGVGVTPRIYGAGFLVSAGSRICIAEGELDSLILTQLGYSAVGVPGANTWKRHWRRLFEDFTRVYIFCDGDDAGHGFRTHLMAEIPTAEAVMMPPKQDVNSMFLKEGRDYFDRILR